MGFFKMFSCVQRKKINEDSNESYKPSKTTDESVSEKNSEVLKITEEELQKQVAIYDKIIIPTTTSDKIPELLEKTAEKFLSHRDDGEQSQDNSVDLKSSSEPEQDADEIIEILTENLDHLREVQEVVMNRGAQLAELEKKLDVLVGAKEDITQQLEHAEEKPL